LVEAGRWRLYAYAEGRRVIYVGLKPLEGVVPSPELEEELREYFRGRRKTFTFYPDLSIHPTVVRRVLEYVYFNLPYGRTATYSEVARSVGTHPKVVGMAMARNRHLILVPCHRVVGKRDLGGFSGGLELKRYLLRIEGVGL